MLKRFKLKLLEVEDLELVRRWRNDSRVGRFMLTETFTTRQQQLSWYINCIQNNAAVFYWMLIFDNNKIGVANLTGIDYINRHADFAFYLDPDKSGYGFGALAEYAILEHGFTKLRLHKLCAQVVDFNKPVIAQHERFGFKVEGRLRDQVKKDGRFRDYIQMGLLEEEWNNNRQKIQRLIEKLNV